MEMSQWKLWQCLVENPFLGKVVFDITWNVVMGLVPRQVKEPFFYRKQWSLLSQILVNGVLLAYWLSLIAT